MRSTILHISDLHRDPCSGLGNGPLSESLFTAVEEFGGGIDLVVVSGDVVHGLSPTADRADLRTQYDEAYEFLFAVIGVLLGGDRDRLVVVPGNHDVSYPTFLSSLERVELKDDTWRGLLAELLGRDTEYRWDWGERALYQIVNKVRYRERLSDFADFYDRIYDGQREFDLDPSKQFDVFDYPDRELTLVGYSSCCSNDPWHTLGHIHSDAFAASFAALGPARVGPRALIGVWHHSVSGPPHKPDFMDEERVQLLLTKRFSLGLHGHQHRAERVQRSSRFDMEGEMTVLSAGTLCGGAEALPPGRPRSFNLIELDTDKGEGRFHVYEMVNDALDHPIWAARPPRIDGSRVFPLHIAQEPIGGVRRAFISELERVQRLIGSGEYDEAKARLQPHSADDLARRLLLETALRSDDQALICATFDPPTSDREVIHLLEALWDAGKIERLAQVLQENFVTGSSSHDVQERAMVMRRKLAI